VDDRSQPSLSALRSPMRAQQSPVPTSVLRDPPSPPLLRRTGVSMPHVSRHLEHRRSSLTGRPRPWRDPLARSYDTPAGMS